MTKRAFRQTVKAGIFLKLAYSSKVWKREGQAFRTIFFDFVHLSGGSW